MSHLLLRLIAFLSAHLELHEASGDVAAAMLAHKAADGAGQVPVVTARHGLAAGQHVQALDLCTTNKARYTPL